MLAGVNADALGGAVVDRRKDRGGAFDQRHGRGRVQAPHHVGTGGHDRAVVRARDDRLRLASGRQSPASRITRST